MNKFTSSCIWSLLIALYLVAATAFSALGFVTDPQAFMSTSATTTSGASVSISFATNPVSVADNTGAGTTVTTFTQTPDASTPTVQSCSQSPCPFAIGGSTGAWKVIVASGVTLTDATGQTFVIAAASGNTLTYSITASGGTITCDIGPAYHGAVPAAAQAAGFTHCVANYDFTSTAFANPNVWLAGDSNAHNCVGSSPVLWATGIQTNYTDCNDVQMTNDTANGGPAQVAEVSYHTNETQGSTTIDTESDNGLPNPVGLDFYYGYYTEQTMRLDPNYNGPPTPQSPVSSIYYDYWEFSTNGSCPSCPSGEADFIEAYSYDKNGNAAYALAGAPFPSGSPHFPSSMNLAQYHKIAMLFTVTSDNNNQAACSILDDGATGNSGQGTPSASGKSWYCQNMSTPSQGNVTTQRYHILVANIGPQSSGAQVALNQNVFIQNTSIWACSNYHSSPCYSSSLIDY